MQIDWLTVIAQIVNFLILVWLLKRFLYKPVITAMEEREKRIAARMQEATQREETAAASRDKYDNLHAQLSGEKDEMLKQAKRQADSELNNMLDQVREEVAAMQETWLADLKKEQANYLDALRKEGGKAIMKTSSQVLRELSGSSLEKRILEVFMEKLHELPETEAGQFAGGSGPLQVNTAFETDKKTREQLEKALAAIAPGKQVAFNQSPDLVCGIEVRADGTKLGWDVGDYLSELEQHMSRYLRNSEEKAGE